MRPQLKVNMDQVNQCRGLDDEFQMDDWFPEGADAQLSEVDTQKPKKTSVGGLQVQKKLRRIQMPSFTGSMFAVLCAVCAGFVSWLVDRSAEVCIPAWLVAGVFGGTSMFIVAKAYAALVQQCKNLGFGGVVQLMERKVQKNVSLPYRSSVTSGSMYMAPSHTQAPRPELPQHPFVSGDGGKDWFRLMQKAVLDTISSKDISKSSAQQIHTLMPPLVLDSAFEFTLPQLGKPCLNATAWQSEPSV